MVKLIDTISCGDPKTLVEITTLGRTLKKRAADVLAYFDWPGTSNGPTEAINGPWRISVAPRSGSATSPTTSPDRCSRPAGSGRNYTLGCEEPVTLASIPAHGFRPALRCAQVRSASAASAPTAVTAASATIACWKP